MSSKDVFTSKDLVPRATLDSASNPTDYIAAFRDSHTSVSTPEQWIAFLDALHQSELESRQALGLQGWTLHEFVPQPPDLTPHILRTIRRHESVFIANQQIAYFSLLHKHVRGIRIIVRNGNTPESPLETRLATRGMRALMIDYYKSDADDIFGVFDNYLKTYRLPSEIAKRPPIKRSE